MKRSNHYLIQLASNGVDHMSVLKADFSNTPQLMPYFTHIFACIDEARRYARANDSRYYRFKEWITGECPYTEQDKRHSGNNLTGVVIYHLVTLKKMLDEGIDLEKFARESRGIMGHSIGLLSGSILALGCRADTMNRLTQAVLRYIVCVTTRSQELFLARTEHDPKATGGSAMLSVTSYPVHQLRTAIATFNTMSGQGENTLYLGLINSDDMAVACGTPDSLQRFQQFLQQTTSLRDSDFIALEASEPYHSAWLEGLHARLTDDLAFTGFDFSGAQLLCPVFSTRDGANLQSCAQLFNGITEIMCHQTLDWPVLLANTLPADIDTIYDLGPGPLTKLFTQNYLRANSRKIRQVSIDKKRPVEWASLAGRNSHAPQITQENAFNINALTRKHDMKAMVFAGQGTQRKGMGTGLFDKYPKESSMASDILGYDIRELCEKDPANQLNNTAFTQPAIYFVNALWTLQMQENTQLDHLQFVAGHSLGEYNALYAAGVIDLFDGLKLVQKRGNLMANSRAGAMASVLGMDENKLSQTILAFGFDSVFIANKNTPEQIVITGDSDQVNELCSLLTVAGASNVIPLNTSGAFHSPFMSDAAQDYARFIEGFTFNEPRIQVLANVTARPHTLAEIKTLLVRQIDSPVLWSESMMYLLQKNITSVAEAGESQILGRMFTAIKDAFNDTATTALPENQSKVA